jgi:hypothetical protein
MSTIQKLICLVWSPTGAWLRGLEDAEVVMVIDLIAVEQLAIFCEEADPLRSPEFTQECLVAASKALRSLASFAIAIHGGAEDIEIKDTLVLIEKSLRLQVEAERDLARSELETLREALIRAAAHSISSYTRHAGAASKLRRWVHDGMRPPLPDLSPIAGRAVDDFRATVLPASLLQEYSLPRRKPFV